MKKLTFLILSICSIALAGCSSPPKAPMPSGDKVPVNTIQTELLP